MAGQGSARVSLKEIDNSASLPVNRVLTGTPAGVIGRAKRGPAFVPTFFANIQEFQDIFGSFNDQGLDSNSNLFGPLAVNEWMSGNPGQGSFIRLLGAGNQPGFTVGSKKLGNNGTLINNPYANNTTANDDAIDIKGKTFMLGHFVSDTTSSKYLSESGLQSKSSYINTVTITSANITQNETFTIRPVGSNESDRLFTFKAAVANQASEVLIPTATINIISDISTSFDTLLALKVDLQNAVNAFALGDQDYSPIINAFGDLETEYTDTLIKKIDALQVKVKENNTIQSVVRNDLNVIQALASNLQTTITNISNKIGELEAANLSGNTAIFDQKKLQLTDLIVSFTGLISANNGDVVEKFNVLKTNKLTADFLYACEIKKSIDAAFVLDRKITATVDGNKIILTQLADSLDLTKSIVVSDSTGGGLASVTSQSAGVSVKPLLRGILMTPHNVVATLEGQAANTPPGKDSLATDPKGSLIGTLDPNKSTFSLYLTGYKGQINVIQCSFDVTKSNYFANVLNTDPHKIEEAGHYLHAHFDINPKVIKNDMTGITLASNGNAAGVSTHGAFCVPSESNIIAFEDFEKRFQKAVSPWVVSQDFGLSQDGANNDNLGSGVQKLFRFHAIDDGEIGNKQVKIVISNLTAGDNGAFGTFDVSLQRIDSNPLKNDILVAWKQLTLDPDEDNYIARVIGDKFEYWDFDASQPGLVTVGKYNVSNRYVRVEVASKVNEGLINRKVLPCGFSDFKQLKLESKFPSGTIFATDQLLNLVQPPVPMVRSIGKISISPSSPKEVKIIPWGIKFAKKENDDIGTAGFKEYSEQTFNNSILSYSKYFSSAIWDATDIAKDTNFFHLEKIRITHNNTTDKVIDNTKWGDAIFIRNSDAASDTFPTGASRRFFRLDKDLSRVSSKYLSFSFMLQGGFDGLDIFDEEKHTLSNVACYREGLTAAKSGSTIETYVSALDAYAAKDKSEIQLLCIPGIREQIVTNAAIKAATDRFDTMYIMDIEQKDDLGEMIIDQTAKVSVSQTIINLGERKLDTSFAAAFFPDVMLNKPNGGSLKVPPSVAALGVMSRSDNSGTTPWYAPAGITRGLVNASATEFAISREQLDELYDNDINPIYIPAGRDQVYIFGQKTLLSAPSALDRINVRRLLIFIRRKVKQVANTILFKPNTAETLLEFQGLVQPILELVKNQQGLDSYSVSITPNQVDIENNTIRGTITLRPTKSIEFISLDFVVSNSIE